MVERKLTLKTWINSYSFRTKQFRPICLEVDVLPQINGSARITAGEVDVTVGVRAELETIIDPDTYYSKEPSPIRIDFNVEFSANADPRFLGREPMDIAELVRTALEGAYANEEALPTIKEWLVNLHLDLFSF